MNIWDTLDPDPLNWPSTPLYTVEHGPDENRPDGGSGHSDVNSIDWPQDDRFIVTAGRNACVKRWEVAHLGDEDQGLRMTYYGFASSVKSTRLSPDETLIAAGGQFSPDGKIIVWDYETGAIVEEFNFPIMAKIEAVEFTPDGRFLFTGGNRNEGRPENNDGLAYIRVFDVNDNFNLVLEYGPMFRQEYYHFNSDGGLLVSSHEDGTLRLWQVLAEPLQISP